MRLLFFALEQMLEAVDSLRPIDAINHILNNLSNVGAQLAPNQLQHDNPPHLNLQIFATQLKKAKSKDGNIAQISTIVLASILLTKGMTFEELDVLVQDREGDYLDLGLFYYDLFGREGHLADHSYVVREYFEAFAALAIGEVAEAPDGARYDVADFLSSRPQLDFKAVEKGQIALQVSLRPLVPLIKEPIDLPPLKTCNNIPVPLLPRSRAFSGQKGVLHFTLPLCDDGQRGEVDIFLEHGVLVRGIDGLELLAFGGVVSHLTNIIKFLQFVMRAVYGRGLNVAAQLKSHRRSLPEFEEIEELRNSKVKQLGCGYLQSYYLLQDGQFLKTGYLLDSLSSVRILNLHRLAPSVIPFLQKMTFLGKMLSFRAGDEVLTLTNRDFVVGAVGLVATEIAESRVFCWNQSGELFAMGENYMGQLGTKNKMSYEFSFTEIVPIKNSKVTQIGCGYQHTIFANSHSAHGCGKATQYQIPIKKNYEKEESRGKVSSHHEHPQLILSGAKIRKVGCGMKYSMIWTDRNRILTMGSNHFGQCGHNYLTDKEVSMPTEVPFLDENDPQEYVLDIACGSCHSLILTNKELYFLGSVEQNQNPFSSFQENICSPTIINLPSKPIKIFAKFDRSAVITEDNKCYLFGGKDYSNCGGESGKLQVLEQLKFGADSLIGLGFSHTIIYP